MNLTYRPLFDQITITFICAVLYVHYYMCSYIHRNILEARITYTIFLKVSSKSNFDIYYMYDIKKEDF